MQTESKLKKQDLNCTGFSSFLKHYRNTVKFVHNSHTYMLFSTFVVYRAFPLRKQHFISNKIRFLKKGGAVHQPHKYIQ